jgi:methylmalonyl-CoA mutase, N-terminal domain
MKTPRTLSGIPLEPFYGPAESAPGRYPYTRGIHERMYRGKLWTMRQFAGFGTPEQTNARYRYLLEQGQDGISVAFDLPTLMGCDPGAPLALGEVGKCGVSVATLADMETLFASIPLDQVSVSMTINSPAPVLFAMYLAVAEKQGVAAAALRGTLQNDILKEYIAQKEFLYPPRPSLGWAVDVIEFAARHVPKYNPVSISGYHIREAGSTAVQELAFTLRDGVEYVEATLERGLAVDEFAPRLSFFFNAHNDFFEEIAKYRAARRMWASLMKERFGARDERSLKLRFHAQTAGCTLTWQQPHNNIVRTAYQAMAAVLGGAQSLHTNSYDEAYALPSEQAVTVALRTQQILAHETGIPAVADPLGGSHYVESLTKEIESRAWDYITKIDAMGGMLAAIERNYPQSEIANAAYEYQREVEAGERKIAGVNCFAQAGEATIELLEIGEAAEREQVEKLRAVKQQRSAEAVARALDELKRAAERRHNTIPALLEAVRAYASVGEVCEALAAVHGRWEETPAV